MVEDIRRARTSSENRQYVNILVREDWRATGQSLLYAAYFGAGAIVGNFWTGFLYDTKMRIAEIFLLNAAGIAVVALLIWVFMKRQKQGLNEVT